MRVDVVMPQMGESIAEGTITRWIKQVGDRVEREEPIFEISTDKVDAEIPSPAAGVLVEIRAKEGETVEVNRIVAVIDSEAEAGARAAAPHAQPPAQPPAGPAAPPKNAPPQKSAEERRFVSPVVREIAREHAIDPEQLSGTGAGGRVTKKDILAHIERGPAPAAAPPPLPSTVSSAVEPASRRVPSGPAPWQTRQADPPTFPAESKSVRQPMTQMRRKIAEHMIESRRTSAHVHSVFEIDMTRVVRLRERHRAAYLELHGTKLTFMPFLVKCVCDGLRAWPIVNGSVEGAEIVYRKELNIGIAVALDWGLIVPVIRAADELSIAGLAKRINDLAERARTKKLNPDEVHGGTFTITNPGSFGGLYGLPIINQPQVAILGMGGIQKRPVVIDDAIAIRSMMYVAMSYDHRVVDGAVADQFLARLKHGLEQFDESAL